MAEQAVVGDPKGGRFPEPEHELPVASVRRPRLFVVSDVRLYRDGITAIFAQTDKVDVVGCGAMGDACVRAVELRPDVLLLDATLIEDSSTVQAFAAILPALRIVAFAVSETDHELIACAEAGVSAYVARDGSAEDLVAAVQAALRGELVCPPRVTALLFGHIAALSAGRAPQAIASALTPRECEILPLIEQGLSNKEIAKRLQVETTTVKNHIHNMLEKLHVRRRGEIAALLHRGKSLPLHPSRSHTAV